ncbi:MAG: alpha-2-macroglobulin family protein [Paracoccaceae bacterium]
MKIRALFTLLTVIFMPIHAFAQESPIPARRSIMSQDMDFYGGDIRAIFDTELRTCESACIADNSCVAFTFNQNKGACFLKDSLDSMQAFNGALSAEIVNTPRRVLQNGAVQAARLGFLPAGFLSDATRQAQRFGEDYPVNQQDIRLLNSQVRIALKTSDYNTAYWARAAAVNITDRAADWLDLGQLAVVFKTENKSDLQWIATSSAINAFLRSTSAKIQADAMVLLAQTLETRGYGSEMIPALQLAQSIAPSENTEIALERAMGLYGFRVVEHQIDSDTASPRICAIFSDELVKNNVDYATYVRTDAGNLPVEVNGDQLCIDGFTHGQRVRITLREGLPAASGEKLRASINLEIYVRDRTPSVRFVGRSYVLPKSPNATIPVISVNATEVALRIHRVGDRNLLRSIQDSTFGRALDDYTESWIAERLGELVWEGVGELASTLNEDITTALPIGDALSAMEPGVYAMTARIDGVGEDYDSAATQWFIVTDLGIETMLGNDGLHVFMRGLSDAEALAGVTLTLIDSKNDILGEITTDPQGYAHFIAGLTRGTGSAAPALLTARTTGGDFAFLDLGKGAFDLSDRGVSGRRAPPPIDLFMTTERGAYRPGEVVFATILTRDVSAKAITDLPITMVVTRPDGVEHTRDIVPDMGAGGRIYTLPLAANAQRGTWRFRAYADPNGAALADHAFLVEDFIPERIDFDLDLPAGMITLDYVPDLSISARYLYGAPAEGLAIEVETFLSATNSLPDYPAYQFGLYDEIFDPRYKGLPERPVTGSDGAATISLPLANAAPATRLLEMTATVRLIDTSGRPVERSITRNIAPDGLRIGVKPLFDGVVDEGGLARFEVLAIENGASVGVENVTWELTRLERQYQWYRLDGYWNYEPVTHTTRVANGEITLGADGQVLIETPVDWGHYKLTLNGADTASSVSFYAGWYAADAGSDTPDVLEVGLDRAIYAIGDTVQLRLNARYAGKALVRVVSDRLIDMIALDVVAGETVVDLPVTSDWGPGAYIMATLIQPMNIAEKRNPTRAIGISFAPVEPADKLLRAHFITPDTVDPRGPLTARLQIDGGAGQIYATIAAVDLGILNLTGFETPEPADHYFGQRQLGMELRDVYGQLIDGMLGVRGAVRSGGDAGMSRRNAPPPTEELVAYFSGPLEADENGIITADFDLPSFNGTVRLMAIVWSADGIGQASKDILVRDPVVMSANHPRFLAPGDESWLNIDLTHVFGASGEMTLDIKANGAVTLGDGDFHQQFLLNDGARTQFAIPITGLRAGAGGLSMTLTTPDGKRLRKTESISVRANDPEVARSYRVSLPPGGTLMLDSSVLSDFVPGSGSATLAVGPLARLDVPGLLQALDRYPYGCTEQITSRAMPLMYLSQVSQAMGLQDGNDMRARIEQAITDVLANQSSNGGFGLWRPDYGDFWLDAYVSDFLSRAKGLGYVVPDRAFRASLDNLHNQLNYAGDFENGGQEIAYALMVLARENMASIGDLRYYAEEKADDFATPMALAQLGAALAYYGDQIRADAMFTRAGQMITGAAIDHQSWRGDYGSHLRDTAALISLVVEAKSTAVDVQDLAEIVARGRSGYRSTQEQMWSLLAAHALIEDSASGNITVNGIAASGPVVRRIIAGDDTRAEVRNMGANDVDTILTTLGVPDYPAPAGGDGYRIERAYYTLEGEPVSPDAIHQNDRLAVVLTITPERDIEARLMVNDPLPAGLEIDNPNLLRAGAISALDWLAVDNVATHSEFHDDRFLAAVDWRGTASFTLGYIVRAVSPGTFHQPAALVEDMYRPAYRARTDTGSLTIRPAR